MLARNIVALNAIYAAKLILPLIILPVLAQRLSPEGYGVYMYSLSLSAWLSLFVEYGFNLYSTREIAGKTDERQRQIVVGTQSARVLLALALLPIVLILSFSLTIYRERPLWGIVAWAVAVSTGASPVYFYQAKERLQRVALVEVTAGVGMLLFSFIFIRDDSMLSGLAAIFVFTRFCSTAYLTSGLLKEVKLDWSSCLSIADGWRYLRLGFNFFVFQAAVSLYTSFNVVLLGLFRSPAEVGAYASAERLIRAGLGFIGQASQALFARLNHLKASHPARMENMRRRCLIAMLTLGLVGSLISFTLADFVAGHLFPATSHEVAHLLRIFALLVPAISLSSVLGLHYLIVDKNEVLFNRIIITAAIINLVFATTAIHWFGARGLAIVWVGVEWAICGALIGSVLWSKKNEINLEKTEHV